MGMWERARRAMVQDRVGQLLDAAAAGDVTGAVQLGWDIIRGMSQERELAEFAFRLSTVAAAEWQRKTGQPWLVIDSEQPPIMFARRMVGYAAVGDEHMMSVLWNVTSAAGPGVQSTAVDTLLGTCVSAIAKAGGRL